MISQRDANYEDRSIASSDETYIAKARLDKALITLSKYLNVTGVEGAQKPLQEIVVQQEKEIGNLREQMDVVINQIKQYEGTLDNVAREFLTLLVVVGEKVGDKALLKMLEDTKQRLKKKTATSDTGKLDSR